MVLLLTKLWGFANDKKTYIERKKKTAQDKILALAGLAFFLAGIPPGDSAPFRPSLPL